MVLLVYVDDIIVTGSSSQQIEQVITQLNQQFSLKDLGHLQLFLGIDVSRHEGRIFLSQRHYVTELLHKTGLQHSKPTPTPMVRYPLLSKDGETPLPHTTQYRSTVGALQYVCLTHPDIAFAVNRVSQFLNAPTDLHWQAVKRILRYLNGTLNYGLLLQSNTCLNLAGFTDADWAACQDDRRLTSGFCIFLGGNPISWSSKKQSVVAHSTAEAEYRSLANAATDVTWIQSLLSELSIYLPSLPTLWCDNTSAVAMSANPVQHLKSKHVEIDVHFVRNKVLAGQLLVNYVPAQEQVADILTKPLIEPSFTLLRHKLQVCSVDEFNSLKLPPLMKNTRKKKVQ